MLPHSGLIPSCDLCCKPFTSSKQSVREQESRLSRRRYLKAVSASGSKQAAQVLQLRKAKVVELRRGDLTWRQPPWHFDCTTTIDALQLDSLKEIDSEAARQSQVAVQYTVSPTGAGYFVSGDADTDLPLQCDCCLSTFKQPVKAPFKLWLDPSIAVDEVPHDPSQIPFPPEMSATELGPAVSDAIMLVLPSVNLCGQSDCNIKNAQTSSRGMSGWSAAPAAQKAGKGAAQAKLKGQFAMLKGLGRK